MYKVGSFVVYRGDVCKVKSIKKNKLTGKDFYVLVPLDDESLIIDVPIENKLGSIRDVISKKEVEAIIDKISSIEVLDNINDKMIEHEYRRLFDIGTHESLIQIIKTTYLRNSERLKNKKKASEKDSTYFKRAEKMLYNEFAVVLNKSYEETKEYVIARVEKTL